MTSPPLIEVNGRFNDRRYPSTASMIHSVLPLLLALTVSEPAPVLLAQLTIRERVIIRVPRMPAGRRPLPTPIEYKEGKGPSCVAARTLAGALVTGVNGVDLVVKGGKRLRAKLDGDCAPLDFYSGFYLRPAGDGMVCAGRDAIRVRSGASCPITRFRTLTPKR